MKLENQLKVAERTVTLELSRATTKIKKLSKFRDVLPHISESDIEKYGITFDEEFYELTGSFENELHLIYLGVLLSSDKYEVIDGNYNKMYTFEEADEAAKKFLFLLEKHYQKII